MPLRSAILSLSTGLAVVRADQQGWDQGYSHLGASREVTWEPPESSGSWLGAEPQGVRRLGGPGRLANWVYLDHEPRARGQG